MEARSLRTWWKWTRIANLAGIAVLLIGWATESAPVLYVGFAVLVVSFGARITLQLRSRAARR